MFNLLAISPLLYYSCFQKKISNSAFWQKLGSMILMLMVLLRYRVLDTPLFDPLAAADIPISASHVNFWRNGANCMWNMWNQKPVIRIHYPLPPSWWFSIRTSTSVREDCKCFTFTMHISTRTEDFYSSAAIEELGLDTVSSNYRRVSNFHTHQSR